MRNPRRLFTVVALLAAAVAGLIAIVPAFGGDGPLSAELQDVRAAVAKYHSFTQAEEDGYTVAEEPCVASPAGTMGIHAINPALLADRAIDPLGPEILLYVPKAGGGLELVGVEYFQVALANTPTGPRPWFGIPNDPTDPTRDQTAPPRLGFASSAPSLFGHSFDGPMPGHNPSMPWHYDLHVWVAEENPSGVFAPFNPTLSCS